MTYIMPYEDIFIKYFFITVDTRSMTVKIHIYVLYHIKYLEIVKDYYTHTLYFYTFH